MTRPITEHASEKKLATLSRGVETLARRPLSITACYHIKVFADTNLVSTGDGKFIFETSQDMDGMDLVRVEMYVTTVSSSGIVQVQIRNITQAADMLSTRIQCDASEKSSSTAATQPVIDLANDDVAYPNEIAIDVDAAGTGAKGLGVKLWFR